VHRRKAIGAQRVGQRFGDGVLVLDDQDAMARQSVGSGNDDFGAKKGVARGYAIAEGASTANGKITIYSFYALPTAKWSM